MIHFQHGYSKTLLTLFPTWLFKNITYIISQKTPEFYANIL